MYIIYMCTCTTSMSECDLGIYKRESIDKSWNIKYYDFGTFIENHFCITKHNIVSGTNVETRYALLLHKTTWLHTCAETDRIIRSKSN